MTGRTGRSRVVLGAAALAVAGTSLVGVAVARQVPEPPEPPAPPAVSAPSAAPSVVPSVAPTATPSATPSDTREPGLPASRPVRLSIPALDVETRQMPALGLDADGAMEVPDGAEPVGWYAESPTPGEIGPSVLAGHVNWRGAKGTFFELGRLRRGDKITVDRADGSTVEFRVTAVQQYPKDDFPTLEVYGNTAGPELRLITCGGEFDDSVSSYRDNIVVYAERLPGA